MSVGVGPLWRVHFNIGLWETDNKISAPDITSKSVKGENSIKGRKVEIIFYLLRYILKTTVVLFKVAVRAVGHFICEMDKYLYLSKYTILNCNWFIIIYLHFIIHTANLLFVNAIITILRQIADLHQLYARWRLKR